MKKINLKDYLKGLLKLDPKYRWPIPQVKAGAAERKKVHKKFPYVVTIENDHYTLDDIEGWCNRMFGHENGKCNWIGCVDSYERWYNESGLEDQLDCELDASDKKYGRRSKKGKEMSTKLIEDHFAMVKTKKDAPKEHNHIGTWRTFYIVKTGYDYGYEDFCFKNKAEAIHFKMIWNGENNGKSIL